MVPLPSAQTRLALHEYENLAQFVRRFAPARCLTLDEGSFVHWRERRLASTYASWQLSRSGALAEIRTA